MCPALRHDDSSLLPSAVPSVFVYQTAGRTASRRKAPTRRTLHPTKQKLTSSSSVLDLSSTSAAGLPSPAPALSTTPLRRGGPMVSRSALQSRLWRARRVQGAVKTLQMKLQSCQPNNMLERLPKHQKPFIGLQLRMAGRRKVAAYTREEQEFALALFHKGPAAYRLMRTMFWLPSVSCLRKLMNSCMKTSGPCPVLLQALKGAMENCSAPGRIGTLGFDAMSLTPALRYEESKDIIGGFEQLDGAGGRTHKVANQGLAVVVRTIKDKTKLPIGFNLIQHNPSQSGFSKIVNTCLEAAHGAGMRIVSITCDQERTQWA